MRFRVEALVQHRVRILFAEVDRPVGYAFGTRLARRIRGQDGGSGGHHVGSRLAVLGEHGRLARRVEGVNHDRVRIVGQYDTRVAGRIVVESGVAGCEHAHNALLPHLRHRDVKGAPRALAEAPRVVRHPHVHARIARAAHVVEALQHAGERVVVTHRHDARVRREARDALAVPCGADGARHVRAVVARDAGV